MGLEKNRSCTKNLLEFLEAATAVVDSGKGYDVIYLDFAKAFDKVPRRRLLKKVRAHWIQAGLRIRIRIQSDPDLFGRIRIWKIFTGSGSYRYFGYVKLYKQGKNILKIEVSHIFR